MARVSGFKRLPAEIQELIGRLRSQGRTLDEILGKLNELDVEVPRSTLGRWVGAIDEVAAELRQQMALADYLGTRFGDNAGEKLAMANIQLLQGALFRLQMAKRGEDVVLDSKEGQALATMLHHLTRAEKAVGDATKQRQELLAKVGGKLKEAEEEAAKAGGVGQADMAGALKRIREEVYGMFERG